MNDILIRISRAFAFAKVTHAEVKQLLMTTPFFNYSYLFCKFFIIWNTRIIWKAVLYQRPFCYNIFTWIFNCGPCSSGYI